jgi:hypothetical protein
MSGIASELLGFIATMRECAARDTYRRGADYEWACAWAAYQAAAIIAGDYSAAD